MPELDIAQAWKSFSQERRRGLLAKMTAAQKRSLRAAIDGAQTDSTSTPGAALDFTSNPRNEGLYQMQGSGGTVNIPFSKVEDATAQGYTSSPVTSARYRDDFNATQPSWFEKVTEPSAPNLNPNTTPVDNTWAANRDAAWNAGINALKLGGTVGGNILKRAARTAAGAVQFPFQAAGIVKRLASSDLDTSRRAEDELLAMHPGAQIADRLKEAVQEWRQSKSLAAENVVGDVLGMYLTAKATELPGRAVKGLPEIRKAVAEKYGPRSVELAGGRIPVTIGEAEPTSAAGRLQASLKRSGTGAPKFEKVEVAQQEAVKQIIRRTAQEASGLVGPMVEEPGAAMQDAASATFAKARPMYAAMDKSLKSVPATLKGVSPILRDAINKARNLGVDISPEADGVLFDGKKVTPKDNPELWQRLKDQGVVDDAGEGTPLTAYTKVRSQLLRMQRSATDPALRNAIGNEVRTMTDKMQAAMKGTRLSENWAEANRLWAKAYSLRDVADAITDATKGTPAAKQASGLSPVPTKIQGAGLVARLNTLADDGILDRAFSPDEVKNLRQSADILDRIQRTPVGKGSGESLSRSRGLAHAVSGAKGPIIGAGIGFLLGHGLYGAEAGAGIGFIVQAIGEVGLVNAMTRLDGANALKALETAKTPIEAQRAMKALTTAAAASSTGHQAGTSLKALREEAARRAPAPQ